MKNLLNDILKINDPEKQGVQQYSLSRTILLSSVVLYFICLLILMGFIFIEHSFDLSYIDFVLEALRWPILTFSAYAFGGKILRSTYNDKEK